MGRERGEERGRWRKRGQATAPHRPGPPLTDQERKKKKKVITSQEEKRLELYSHTKREQENNAPPSRAPPREWTSQHPTREVEPGGDTDEEVYFKELAHMTVGLARAAWQAGRSQAGADAAVHRWILSSSGNPRLCS